MAEVLKLGVNGYGGQAAALYCDGTGDYLSVPDDVDFDHGTGDFTYECWMQNHADSGQKCIISTGQAGGGVLLSFRPATPDIAMYVASSFQGFTIPTTLEGTDAQWFHIACVRRNGVVRVFFNGTQAGSDWTNAGSVTTSAGCYVGSFFSGGSLSAHEGFLREVRVSSVARYWGEFKVPTEQFTSDSNTVLLLHLDEANDATSWTDSGDNSFTVTRNGGAIQGMTQNWLSAAWTNDSSEHIAEDAFSTAAYFDGTDSLYVGDHADFDFGTGDFTMEGWFKKDGAWDTNTSLMGCGLYTAGCEMYIGSTGTALRLYVNSTNTASDAIAVKGNEWYHFAIERISGTAHYYVDGVHVGSNTNSGDIQVSANTDIGSGIDTDFKGWIREVRISDTSRYSGTDFTPTTTPHTSDANTVLLLHLDESLYSTSFTDSGNTGHTVTTSGDTEVLPSGNNRHPMEVKKDAVLLDNPIKDKRQAYFFDGDSDYISVPDHADWDVGTGDFTIEFWWRTPDADSYSGFFGTEISTSDWNNSFFHHLDNRIEWNIQGTNNRWDFNPEPHVWYHLAFVRNGTAMKIYANGQALTISVGGTDSSNAVATGNLRFGRNGGTQYCNGWMKEIRVSDTARYTADFTPQTTQFSSDANTLLLLHGNALSGNNVLCSTAFFDGTGDSIQFADHADWDIQGSNTQDYTVDFWFKSNSTGTQMMIQQWESNSIKWGVYKNSSEQVRFELEGMGITAQVGAVTISQNKWYHVAVVKKTSGGPTVEWALYVDGVQNGYLSNSTEGTNAGVLHIGQHGGAAQDFDGWIKNVRISNNNRFSASPVVGETDTITVPTAAPADDANTLLLMKFDGKPDDTTNTNGWLTDESGTHTPTVNNNAICKFTEDWRNRVVVDDGNTDHSTGSYMNGTAKLDWIAVEGNGSVWFNATISEAQLRMQTSDDWAIGTDDFTFECWHKVKSYPAHNVIVDTTAATGLQIRYSSTNYDIYVVGGSAVLTGTLSFTRVINEWQHFACTRSGTDLRVFHNGSLLNSVTNSADIAAPSDHLAIGSERDTSGQVNGFFDYIIMDKGTATYTAAFEPSTFTFFAGYSQGIVIA